MASTTAKTLYPLPTVKSQLVFLNNFITVPNVEVGDFTYYHDLAGAEKFQENNILYHHPIMEDKLIIGKFCSIAMGTRFFMNGAMHRADWLSTYPFAIFDPHWAELSGTVAPFTHKGDTIVGHDVWFGFESIIMPGVTIGNGAIIGTRAVVTKDVPPYSIVAGTPGKILRKRFDENTIAALESIQWWNWPIEKITENLPAILSTDVKKLEKIS